MRKPFATIALLAIALVPLRADVTVVHTTTMQGASPMAAGIGPASSTMRIKGTKGRVDTEAMGQRTSTIADLNTREVIVLNHASKTAEVIKPGTVGDVPVPEVDASFKSTGKSQTIEGLRCDQHTFAIALDMAAMGQGGQMPPDTAAMMKDVTVTMNGSSWLAKDAPGAAEFNAFLKSATSSKLLAGFTGMQAGQSGSFDKLLNAMAAAQGIPCLTEMEMIVGGTGPMVEMMKQMAAMKVVQRLSSISTETIPADVFSVPEGYTIKK